MNKTFQRILTLLLVLLMVCSMFPAALATEFDPEDTSSEPMQPTEEVPETTSPTEIKPTEIPTEVIDPTEPSETVEPTGDATKAEETENTEPPVEETKEPDPTDPIIEPVVSDMEEEVSANRVTLGTENVPMLFASRAAVKGTHYHRAIIWLSSDDAKLDFTYKSKNYSVDRLYVHGVIVDGKRSVAYCVDPGVITTESSGGYSGSETAWDDLDIDTQTAVGLAVLYGAPNGMSSSTKKTMLTYEFATQIIIHEILLGYRSNLPPFTCTNAKIINKFGTNADGSTNGKKREITSGSVDYSSLHGEYIDRAALRSAYDTIAANMASHYTIPSFASRYNAAAKTYEMTQQSDGTYAVTLTDTNNILSKCTFKNGNGLTYSVSGNKLTIKSSTPFDTAKSCALSGSVGASKNVPNLESQTFFLWSAGSNQRLITLQEATSDPVPIYFNVIAKESKGTAKIIKKATNGGSVSGWTFTVKNASGTTIGTYTTDSTGVIAIDLEPGTYSVTEKATTDKYWVNDATSTRKVTVKAGETASVTFTNQWKGKAQIVKTATNGGTVSGWHFTVKNSSGTKIGDYVTDATGIITIDLEPGTYTVTETDADAKYWVKDSSPTKTVTVKAGQTAKVTFKNQYRGQAQIVKTTTNGGKLDGWHFTVKNSSGTKIGDYVTDSTGIITLDLEPGTYTVTETDGAQKYWVNDSTPSKTVTVKAGQTAKVTFTNQYRGQAQIIKTTTNGGTVAGWHFTVKNSSGTKIGDYVTDSTGIITLDLEPGTYTVTETDGAQKYWVNDAAPSKTVTVKAGQTAKVTFKNQYRGQAQIVRTTTNGGTVAGWHFTVKNSSGTKIGDYVTDSTGIITLDLEPGTYTVTETDGAQKYWVNDASPSKTVTVKAGETAKVTFKNQYRGQAQIVKTTTNGGKLDGWHFTVKNSSGTKIGDYVTDTTGIITLDLEPGTYTVTETDSQGKYWVNDPSPTKTVTVKAGETAKVTFKNQFRGQAQIIKTTTNGGKLDGWHFTVKNTSGTKIGDYVTDTTGIITLDLEPGTYTVTETDPQAKYWVNDPTPTKTVTVKAGETAKVTFNNQYRGQAQIVKTTTNGGTLKGWAFTVKDSSGVKVGTYTTEDTGIITVDLEPGTYTVIEADRNDPYWYCDTEAKTVTVKAGETAMVTFENKWIGKAKIIKTLSNPEAGSVEGWSFTIADSSGKEIGKYQTDSSGTILTDLEPGTYTVTEVLEENSLWQCTTQNPQTITVVAGQTAEVTFTNALRPAKISIEKVDFQGNPLKDVEFKLEWSQDGKTWKSVEFTSDTVPKLGGCTTNGLKGGSLTTDKNGIAEFTGLYPTLQYRLTETKTQEGYQLLKDPIVVENISAKEDLHMSLRVVNFQTFALPDTGRSDFMWIIPGISISCLLGIHILISLRRKEDNAI